MAVGSLPDDWPNNGASAAPLLFSRQKQLHECGESRVEVGLGQGGHDGLDGLEGLVPVGPLADVGFQGRKMLDPPVADPQSTVWVEGSTVLVMFSCPTTYHIIRSEIR